MARNERSAGVVVFYDDPGGRLFLLLDYGRHWDFPKGHVEKDEDDRTTALRELEEETGLTDVSLNDTFAHEITYYFRDRRTKVLIRKTVVFFLVRDEIEKVTLSHEHVGYIYLPFAEAVKKADLPRRTSGNASRGQTPQNARDMMTHPTNSRRQALLPSVILLTLVALAYSPIFRAGYIWDDPDYVVNNLTLRNLPGLWHMWTDPLSIPQYYPLVHTTFWIEYHLWNLHPLGYHIDNLLLHAFGCILFYRLLQKLEVPGAFIAAMLFAVHPVQVESVAWITERKNVLCGVFYFSAFLAWIRFDTSRSRRDYIALLRSLHRRGSSAKPSPRLFPRRSSSSSGGSADELRVAM